MTKAPWSHPLATRLAQLPRVRPTVDEAAKQVRNRLRAFSAESIVDTALATLNRAARGTDMQDLQSWPWITLLLVKLVLEDGSIELTRGQPCTLDAFNRCRQTLWDAHGARDRKESSPGAVYRMVRALMLVQMQLQQDSSWGFLRWPALLARLEPQHPSRQLFAERFGMEPQAFLCLCFAAHMPLADGHVMTSLQDFEPLRRRFGADVDRFFDEFAKDLPWLRAELQAERGRRLIRGEAARSRCELSEFPWLAQYPLLRRAGDRFAYWHPKVFARGMDDAVHRRLSQRQRGAYANDFSKVFEGYVLELLDMAALPYLSEVEYKRALSVAEKAVEAIVHADGVNVLVEAKLTAHSDDVLLSHQYGEVLTGFKRVREAMQQGWSVVSRLLGGSTPPWPCTRATQNFLIVVTSQPMMCATGEHFRRMFRHDFFDPEKLAERKASVPTAHQLERLPLNHVLIASIEEFEHLMGGVRDGQIQLMPFLREVAAAHADPQTSVMFLDQLIAKKATGGSPPAVIDEALQAAEVTIRALL